MRIRPMIQTTVKHSLRNSIFTCILLVLFEKFLRAHSCCWCDKADDYIVLLNQDMFAREYVHLRSASRSYRH